MPRTGPNQQIKARLIIGNKDSDGAKVTYHCGLRIYRADTELGSRTCGYYHCGGRLKSKGDVCGRKDL